MKNRLILITLVFGLVGFQATDATLEDKKTGSVKDQKSKNLSMPSHPKESGKETVTSKSEILMILKCAAPFAMIIVCACFYVIGVNHGRKQKDLDSVKIVSIAGHKQNAESAGAAPHDSNDAKVGSGSHDSDGVGYSSVAGDPTIIYESDLVLTLNSSESHHILRAAHKKSGQSIPITGNVKFDVFTSDKINTKLQEVLPPIFGEFQEEISNGCLGVVRISPA